MAINLKRTSQVHAQGVKMLVYGEAGAGKTTLISTLPKPIILSAEAGLLSLQGQDIPYIEIDSMATLGEAYTWLTESAEAKNYESVALDSISEIAEVCLLSEKAVLKDGRAAYGETNEKMAQLIRAFRDLTGRHVLMTAKLEKVQDEQGRILYGPSMPGKRLTQDLAFFFDEVLAMRIERDAEGVVQRALQCAGDGLWSAKDRSGKLDMWEEPDLGAVIAKIMEKTDEI